MKPTDIAQLVTLGPPTLAPDGTLAVVAATRADLDENEYRSALWIVPTDASSAPRRLTWGRRDTDPRFSPDGRWIAFLRTESSGDEKGSPVKSRPQLHLLAVAGGDARPLTARPGGAGAPVWSPDSRSIAFVARVLDEGRYGQDEKVPAGKEPPRRVTGLQYRHDGVGFTLDRRSHVFVLDLDAIDDAAAGPGEPRQLTDGDYEDTEVAWSADGTLLAFVSARHDQHELDRRTDAYLIRPDGSELRRLTDTSLLLATPTFTPDGNHLLAAGVAPDADGWWIARNAGLWRIAVDGSSGPERLTDEETVNVAGDRIMVDGRRAVVTVENRGAVDLFAVALDGSGAEFGSPGRRQIVGFDTAAGVTVVAYADATTGGELARLDDGGPTPLTDFGADIRPALVPIEEITSPAPDGYPVHGFLALPAGTGPHPVLLMIHGGPFAQYGWTLLDEAQVYAGAGYAVLFSNPRGSSGYGQAHGRYIRGDVGERQAPDLLALLDAALERPDLDASRVGVLGGSHGGYMTSWLIGHTDRFAAAVSERAVNAIDSFEGASDIGWDFADNLYGTDPDQRRVQSPLTYADAITTPLLIVHSEHDWRCPIEQAQRLYVALRKRSADVEMLLFPGEGHELSRSGVPSHRVARFEAIVGWFDRYLQ